MAAAWSGFGRGGPGAAGGGVVGEFLVCAFQELHASPRRPPLATGRTSSTTNPTSPPRPGLVDRAQSCGSSLSWWRLVAAARGGGAWRISSSRRRRVACSCRRWRLVAGSCRRWRLVAGSCRRGEDTRAPRASRELGAVRAITTSISRSASKEMESLPVPSVQAMVAASGGADVPPRYLRPQAAADAVACNEGDQIPIIDYGKLLLDNGEESARLHEVCQDWGFFQLTNHGVPDDVVEGMNANIQELFQLSAETKKQFAQERGQLEGYGQLFVVSEDQKLGWADILYLNTQPPKDRNMRFWPDQPASFRSTLDKYSTAVKHISDSLLAIMAKNLGLEPEVVADKCGGGIQSVRMNYYPPCAQADKVVGFSPHTDSDLLTLVLQVNNVQGLQIKRHGSWFPVKPLKGAFIVNIGDIFEIFTNGRYRSIEQRALVDPKQERLSFAAFHSPDIHAMIGPLKEMWRMRTMPIRRWTTRSS